MKITDKRKSSFDSWKDKKKFLDLDCPMCKCILYGVLFDTAYQDVLYYSTTLYNFMYYYYFTVIRL